MMSNVLYTDHRTLVMLESNKLATLRNNTYKHVRKIIQQTKTSLDRHRCPYVKTRRYSLAFLQHCDVSPSVIRWWQSSIKV